MPLDGMFIQRLSDELNSSLKGGRIDNASGLSKTDYVLDIRVPGKTLSLFLSVSYANPTIFITDKKFEKTPVATSFTMLLRKYLVGGFIINITQENHDRIIKINILRKDEIMGNEKKSLIIELIGRYANLLLLDDNDKVVDAIKQLSVLEENSRGIMRGLKYEPLLNNKISFDDPIVIDNTFNNESNIYSKNIVDKISGISPILANYLVQEHKLSGSSISLIIQNIKNRFDPVMYQKDYYYFNIYQKENVTHYPSLSSLLLSNYETNIEAETLRSNNTRIFQTVATNLKRINKKIDNMNSDLLKDKNADELRIKGEVLLSNIFLEHPRSSTITLTNFYDGSDIVISLDPSKSIKENANNYFKKYKKSRLAVEHIESQIALAEDEKSYFELLSYQLENASLKDILEIQNELINNGYLINKNISNKKSKVKPNYLEEHFNGCQIYVGKNNIQNDYLTHTLGNKDDLWFHIKAGHGSHVIVRGDNKYSEAVIRKAAKLAASHSEAFNSSSVPVDYTEIKNIKKVPGRKGSFVTYTKYKTIYIDPKREGD